MNAELTAIQIKMEKLPRERLPEVIASAIILSIGIGGVSMTTLLEQVQDALQASGDDWVEAEFVAALEDWV